METNYKHKDHRSEKKPRFTEKLKHKCEVKSVSIPTNLLLTNDSIELDITTNDKERKIVVSRNSRCVSVDTILPSPLGRRKKKSVTAKSEIIKFRCSLYEKKILKVKARKSGLTLSEYFRRIALEQKITERLTDEQIGIYKMLIKYHNSFKSIGNMFNKRNPKLTETVHELANEIKGHLKQFKHDW